MFLQYYPNILSLRYDDTEAWDTGHVASLVYVWWYISDYHIYSSKRRNPDAALIRGIPYTFKNITKQL